MRASEPEALNCYFPGAINGRRSIFSTLTIMSLCNFYSALYFS